MTRRKANAGGLDGPNRDRFRQLSEVAGDFKDWKPAREALERVRSVETIFPQINHATRIGGWPIQRITLLHGPSNMGKTIIALGLGLSFLLAGHYYGFVDAELTTAADWVKKLMGKMAENPAFQVLHPTSYEETVDRVRSFAETIAIAREKGRLPEDTSGLIVVDSLRKLVPKRLLEKISKDGAAKNKKGSVDGMAGRAAQYRAALNSAWLDELVPLMSHCNTGMLIIGRESEKIDAGMWDDDWKLTGGKAVEYDSSLIARVERASWVEYGDKIVGERLRVRIRKTKVAGKSGKVVDCYVHISNGVLIPEGFDRARDVLEMAKQCGAVELAGSWYSDAETGESLGQGENAAVKFLTDDKDALSRLEKAVSNRMSEVGNG